MNYLSGKTVYLAGPIHDSKVVDDGIGWRNYITPILKEKYNVIVDDPCQKTLNGMGEVKDDKKMFRELIKTGNFLEVKRLFYPVVKKDLRSVDKCDFMIVVYDPTIHMMGTIAEIILACSQKKPMLMWYDKSKIEHFNPWVLTYFKATSIFTEWEDMFKHLDTINAGVFDTSYWC